MIFRSIIISVSALLTGCSNPAPELAGTWKSERTTLTIAQEKSKYKIVAVNPKGILSGNYTSEFREGRLTLQGALAPLCGDMKYTASEGKLNFCGEEFVRAQP